MSMGETINFYGSLLCLTGCLTFIAVYTIMPFITNRIPWWKYQIGRMMITKAAAIAGLMLIIVITYAFGVNVEWIRLIRGVFAAVVGVMMFYQARIVYRLQKGYEGDNG
jgi:hypothetical protein